MIDVNKIKQDFKKHNGVLKTKDLRETGLSSRQIKKLVDDSVLSKIKTGYYELADEENPEEVLIMKLFPTAVLFLESALLYYNYTDRIPNAWQIAVDRDSEKSQYNITYPRVEAYYQEPKFLSLGLSSFKLEGVNIRIFDKDRTMCDVLRYEKKIEKEVFTNAVMRYINDPNKNMGNLYDYAKKLNVSNKAQSQIGKWL